MNTETLTPNEVRRIGMSALRQALGPVGMIRFLQQFETGHGDYTRDHEAEEDRETVQSLARKVLRWRRARGHAGRPAEGTRRRKVE
ncbi:MAG: hypothetical protein FJ290_26090 [Planctomycetes bacterium]|nr:hypothetical protein [Planctomycetota bacterium]